MIYTSRKPKFCIMRDSLNWILGTRRTLRDGKVVWVGRNYYPNLALLLEELAEIQFKKNAKRLKDIKDLEKSIDKVYDLIQRVAERFKNKEGV